MTNNTKTWPKEIYLYGDMAKSYDEQSGKLGWSADDFAPNVKYIRADLIEKYIQQAVASLVEGI